MLPVLVFFMRLLLHTRNVRGKGLLASSVLPLLSERGLGLLVAHNMTVRSLGLPARIQDIVLEKPEHIIYALAQPVVYERF